MKSNEYVDLYVLQGLYASGYEDIAQSEDIEEVLREKKDYITNEGGYYRIIIRRELNTNK